MGIRLWIRGSIIQAWLRGAPSSRFPAWAGRGQRRPSFALGQGGPQGWLPSRAAASPSTLDGHTSSDLARLPELALLGPSSHSRELQASPQPGVKSPEPCHVFNQTLHGPLPLTPHMELPEVGAGTACPVSTPRVPRRPDRATCVLDFFPHWGLPFITWKESMCHMEKRWEPGGVTLDKAVKGPEGAGWG